ncbi:pseudouridine-5'-phosphate glycosidase [Aggregatilinea lenta]|uniref:pseudouridine-5'-phosphate glycosidase n=1 Tax=Aggregatilinea lenta TaxID=913108 RepID=UPI000E5AF252|nr:pseudouridine-5'-phosphate glycosidase [Aggregatilinea lenta]
MANSHLVISDEVGAALLAGSPVVALESTLITHGFPFPANIETATAMEDAIRAEGAVPATIAVINGQIRVGLSRDEIEMLGGLGSAGVRKCSRRDLPIVVGLKQHGATTVAGTMIVAHMAGISVFATGGIGGVHRGHPQDISADLIELGRTPITVVCAGAKSILDLPLTLEVLETQGVPVIGYGTETLPAFYSRSSGLPVDQRVDTPEDVARIARARDALRLAHGILVTVPVPEADALPEDVAEAAIAEATRQADALGIHGKDVTPFVLGNVLELTEGRSQQANIAALVNNARTGAQIAAALAILP